MAISNLTGAGGGGAEYGQGQGGAYHGEELPLADDDARLPWLEGDDEEEGYNTGGQTFALVVAALLILAMAGAGVWWLTRDARDAEFVADGSTIESPGPYKQRPDDPGGKVFEGTGDSSFKVSEGQSNPARLGEAEPQPAPGFTTLKQDDKGAAGSKPAPAAKPPAVASAPAPKPSAKPSAPAPKPPAVASAPAPKPPTVAEAPAAASSGVGVQVGAYSNRAAAEAGWNRLTQQHSALKGMKYRVVEGKADIGTVYRLQAVADNAASAGALCRDLKASGLNCYVKP